MSDNNNHIYYPLKHKHQEIDDAIDKIKKGEVLSKVQYNQLIREIGLDNISTFSGDYDDLRNLPDLNQIVQDTIIELNIPSNKTVEEKIELVKQEVVNQIKKLLDAKADEEHSHSIFDIEGLNAVINAKADAEHKHDDQYYTKGAIDKLIQEVESGFIDGSEFATLEDLSRVNELIAEKANREHLHEISNVKDLQLELNKKANKAEFDNVYNKQEVYSKNEVDNLLKDSANSDHTHDEFYTKEEIDSNYLKVDDYLEIAVEHATKTDLQTLENRINVNINKKADKDHKHDEFYTKEEIDDKIVENSTGGTIDLGGYVKKSELNEAMATKADITHVHEEYSPVYHTHDEYSKTDHVHDNYADKEHKHDLQISDIEGLQAALDNKSDADDDVIPDNIMDLVNGKADIEHSHDDYALVEHNHGIINIAGLQEILDNKANKNEIINRSELDGKADVFHSHSEYAPIEHSHYDYADINHTHDGFAEADHIHENYADKDHTHTFMQDAISDLQSKIDNKVDVDEVYTKEEVDDKIVEIMEGGSIDLGGYVKKSELDEALMAKAELGHTHDDYAELEHTHDIDDLNGIKELLDNKANITDVPSNTDLIIALSNKAELVHNHEISDINELEAELNKKINKDEIDGLLTEELGAMNEQLNSKADIGHTHDGYADKEHEHNDLYYTKSEIDTKIGETGSASATELLIQAKVYTDTAVSAITQGAPEDMNTFSEVDAAIKKQANTIETMVAGKADVNHVHTEYATIADEEARDIFETTELTVNTVGGIASGTDLNGLTVKQILTKLLFPYVAPTIAVTGTPNGGTFEKGNNQTIKNVKVVVTKKSEKITKLEVTQGSNVIAKLEDTSIANGGTFNFSVNIPVNSTNVQVTGKVTDSTGTSRTATSGSFTFVYPYYIGACAANAEINESLVKELTKKVESKGTKTIKYTVKNQKMIFAYPKSYGSIKKILDANSFDVTSTFTRHEIKITGLDGTAQSYYVYVNEASSVDDFEMKFSY